MENGRKSQKEGNIIRAASHTVYQASKSAIISKFPKLSPEDTNLNKPPYKTSISSIREEEEYERIPVEQYMLSSQMLKFFSIYDTYTDTDKETCVEELSSLSQKSQIFQRKKEIEKLKEQIKMLEEKSKQYSDTISQIKKIINDKQTYLRTATDSHEITKKNYLENKQKHEKNIVKNGKYKIFYHSLINKKLMEISYIFFNTKIEYLFFNPGFKPTDTESDRYDKYSDNPKLFGTLMGNISFLLNYFSQTFNITLRFPLYVQGSKSYCVVNRKDFEFLFFEPKNDDRFVRFENTMRYQKENLKEILNYFSQFHNILSTERYQNIISDSERALFFKVFIDFNQVLYHFVEKACKEDMFYKN